MESSIAFNTIGSGVSQIQEAISSMAKGLEKLTKVLKLQANGKDAQARKLVISTNFLETFGFAPNARVVEDVRPQGGMDVRLATEADVQSKKVYQRTYKNRKQAVEAMLDIRSQEKLDSAFGTAQKVHITFTHGLIRIEPIFEFANKSDGSVLEFTLPKDEDGFMGSVFRAVQAIKAMAPAQIAFTASETVQQSTAFLMFEIQLRRLGYAFAKNDHGVLSACLPSVPVKADRSLLLDLTAPDIQPTEARFNHAEPLHAMNVCTAGLDVVSVEDAGFEVKEILEWRPPEARDEKSGADKHETGATCAVVNAKACKSLFNEDIYEFNSQSNAADLSQVNFLHAALCCTEHSNLKTKQSKQDFIDSLATSVDMVFPLLEIITAGKIPMVMIENVPGFLKSSSMQIFKKTLEQRGYAVHASVLNGRDYNAYTTRPRAFVFATALDAQFDFPKKEERTTSFWNDIVLPGMDDLLATPCTENSVSTAIKAGRMRFAKEGDALCPTLTKSQDKKVKDATRVKVGDWYYWPSTEMLRKIMSVRDDFSMEYLRKEVQVEIVGQAICMKTHGAILKSVKSHLYAFLSGAARKAVAPFSVKEIATLPQPAMQMALF